MAQGTWSIEIAPAAQRVIEKQRLHFGGARAGKSSPDYAGLCFRVPILSGPEKGWRDAVRWLEERQAADAEWPWPRWSDYAA